MDYRETLASANSFVYLPEYLGGSELEIPEHLNPYQLLLLTVMVRNNGTLSENLLRNISPKSDIEANDSAEVQNLLIEHVDDSDLDDQTKILITTTMSGDANDLHWENLYVNSYENFNPFSKYKTANGIRTVEDIPVELRQFVWRADTISKATSKILNNPSEQAQAEERRYSTIEDIVSAYPSVRIPSRILGKDEELVIKMINGDEELPQSKVSSKFACVILDVLGAGSIARSMKRLQEGDDLSQREKMTAELGSVVCGALGGINAGKKVIEGRLAWGVKTPRLRTGDDIPKVTFPKPGV